MNELNPKVRSRLRQARRNFENNKLSAAETLYREIVTENPEIAEAWIGLGDVSRDPAERETAYRLALEIAPDSEAAQSGLAAAAEGRARPELTKAAVVETTPEPVDQPVEAAEAVVEADNESHLHMPEESEETLFCVNHPNTETTLRCNKCGKPVCSKCISPTPVGYRCKDCIREHEDIYFTAEPIHYFLAAAVAFPLGLIAAALASALGWFVIFIAPVAGTVIGRACFYAIGRRRGRYIPHMVAGIVALGSTFIILGYLLLLLMPLLLGDGFSGFPAVFGGGIYSMLFNGIYAVMASGAAFYQLK